MRKQISWFSEATDLATLSEQLTKLDFTVKRGDLHAAQLVIVDAAAASRSPETHSDLLAACREKPVLLFSDERDERDRFRREGAYYVGPSTRTGAELLLLVRRAAELTPSGAPHVDPIRRSLVGESPAMVALRRALWRLSESPLASVLLQGEPGTGKRSCAIALHAATATAGPFEDLSQETELESALAATRAGTVYLGDLNRLSSSAQRKLATFLARCNRARSWRLVGALTTIPGVSSVAWSLPAELSKRFLLSLDVPALRERSEDMPLLIGSLLSRLASEQGTARLRLTADAQHALEAHLYSDNVRELERLLRRALLLASDGCIDVSHLPASMHRAASSYRLPSTGVSLELLEREVLSQALRLAGGNRTRAASLLGLTRDQVRYRLSKLGLEQQSEGRVA